VKKEDSETRQSKEIYEGIAPSRGTELMERFEEKPHPSRIGEIKKNFDSEKEN